MIIKKNQKTNMLYFEGISPDGNKEYACMSEFLFKEAVNQLIGNEVFTALCEIQKLAWADDDCMEQDTLFELQEKLSALTLSVAGKVSPKAVDKLVAEFPWLYEVKGE